MFIECRVLLLVVQGLGTLTRLKVLDVSNNRLEKIEGLDSLGQLEDLWLNDNSIDSWEGIYESLQGPRQSLTTLYLQNNKVVSATLSVIFDRVKNQRKWSYIF